MLEVLGMCVDERKICVKHKSFKDSRAVDFWEDFGKGNPLYAFTQFVNNNDELELLFRGNDGKVIIYRNNHVVWDIKKLKKKKEYHVKFSSEHIKHSDKAEELKNQLNEHFGDNKEKNLKKFELVNESWVCDTYELLNVMFTDYFDYSRTKDKRELEKIFQQYLFTYVFNGNLKSGGYFVFDLEFKQPYPCTAYRESNGNTNTPDMLAVKWEDEGYKLVLIEVKSKSGSCEGKSSVQKHLSGMGKYLEEKVFGESVIKSRMTDAIKIINNYKALELRGFKENSIPFYMRDFNYVGKWSDFKGIEILFVFTDEIIDDEKNKFNYVPDKGNEKGSIKWLEELQLSNKAEIRKSILESVNDIENKKCFIDGKKFDVKVRFMSYSKNKGLQAETI